MYNYPHADEDLSTTTKPNESVTVRNIFTPRVIVGIAITAVVLLLFLCVVVVIATRPCCQESSTSQNFQQSVCFQAPHVHTVCKHKPFCCRLTTGMNQLSNVTVTNEDTEGGTQNSTFNKDLTLSPKTSKEVKSIVIYLLKFKRYWNKLSLK